MHNVVSHPIESVDNALRLLVILRDRSEAGGPGDGLGVVEAARRLGVAPSTAHRLFAMLVHHRFAVQDGTRRYHLGPAFTLAPAGSRRRHDLRTIMRPVLTAVCKELDETAHLIVLNAA